MSTKGMYKLREDKQELTKQLGCMNGIFQLFDRRYLLGQKKLPQGKHITPKYVCFCMLLLYIVCISTNIIPQDSSLQFCI